MCMHVCPQQALSLEQCRQLIDEYEACPSVKQRGVMSVCVLVCLQQALSLEQCRQLIDEYEACPSVKQRGVMSLDGFHAMFNGPQMDLFNPAYNAIYQPMTQPLSDYFIDSSHNTSV